MNIEELPEYYKSYKWDGKHHLYGYPSDTWPNFSWIKSLETRFDWLKQNYTELEKEKAKQKKTKRDKQSRIKKTASIYLIKEMIEWGGSQNGVLQKFNDRCGEENLFELIKRIIENLKEPDKAIEAALQMPGLGLTYASKLLRFFQPDMYGALDSRIRKTLEKRKLRKIYDGNDSSMIDGYLNFLEIIDEIKKELEIKGLRKPDCALSNTGLWRASDIEMSLFQLAD